MNKSDDISLLAAAIVKAQPMVEGAKKGSVNPHFRSKYADLGSVWDAVSEALEKNDLAVSQFPDETAQGLPALTTMLIHKSGQWISATYPLISVKQDPQGFASAQTYARRYGLASVMGVIAEDDDGEGASRSAKPSQKDAIHGTSTLKAPVAAEAYAPMEITTDKATTDKATNAKAWALREIPRIKTLGKDDLDKFSDRFKKAREELKVLDSKTSIELEKALADRLETLFA